MRAGENAELMWVQVEVKGAVERQRPPLPAAPPGRGGDGESGSVVCIVCVCV